MKKKNKIIHIISGLGNGGAEKTLYNIINNTKLIFDIVHYELKDVRSPKTVVLSEWALTKDDSWKIKKQN